MRSDFYFSAGQRDAGLDHLADLVIETSLAIVGDDLVRPFLLVRHLALDVFGTER